MSYRTYYHFNIKENPIEDKFSESDLIDDFRKAYEDAKYAFNEEGIPDQDCSWYDHEKDVKEFSKKYPDIVFELNGVGEETFDIWNKYFQNGKMQFCPANVTFDLYDQNKLE